MKLFLLISLILTCSNLISQVNLTNGLVAYYPFNGNTNDESGNNNLCVAVNNPALTTDRYGKTNTAYRLNGSDSYFKIKDDGSFSTERFSIVLWILTESNELQCILGKRDFAKTTTTGGAQYQMCINYSPYPGVVSNLVGNNSSCSVIASSSYLNSKEKICTQNWYCIAVTYDGNKHKLYLNGELRRDEKTEFDGFLECSRELRIGNWWKQDMQSFKGKIDDLRWYNRALNSDEVKELSKIDFGTNIVKSGRDITICEGDTTYIEALQQKGMKYEWFFNGLKIDNSSHKLKAWQRGVYQVKTNDGNCISYSETINLSTEQKPSNIISANKKFIGMNDSVELSIYQTKANYLWNTGQKTQKITIKTEGSYFAEIDKNGCKVISSTVTIKKKTDELPTHYTRRSNNVLKTIQVKNAASFDILLYDYRQQDGDIITVMVNDQLIVQQHLLSKTPLKIPVSISKEKKSVTVKIIAENLGTIPPNTAMMQCIVDGKKYEVQIISSGEKNAVIKFELN